MVSVPLGGVLVDRTGRVNASIAAGALACAGLTVGIALGMPVLPGVVAFGLLFGLMPGAIMALPGEVVSATHRSTAFGLFFTVYYVGVAGFPPLAGAAQDAAGTPAASLLVGAVLLAGVVPLLAAFRTLQRRLRPRDGSGGVRAPKA